MNQRDDLSEIEALAKAATPGEWHVVNYDCGDQPWRDGMPSVSAEDDLDCSIVHGDGFAQENWRSARGDAEIHANAAHIAHMSPARTLRLIERLREAERMAADDRESADTLALMLADARAQRDTWRITCERMVEEPDQLAAALSRAAAAEARAAALEAAIDLALKLCASTAPKQAVGEVLEAARALTKENPQ